MASPEAPSAGSLEPPGFLWAVDLVLSPGSSADVQEHLDQQANVLGWMLSPSREVNRVSQEEFGRAGEADLLHKGFVCLLVGVRSKKLVKL